MGPTGSTGIPIGDGSAEGVGVAFGIADGLVTAVRLGGALAACAPAELTEVPQPGRSKAIHDTIRKSVTVRAVREFLIMRTSINYSSWFHAVLPPYRFIFKNRLYENAVLYYNQVRNLHIAVTEEVYIMEERFGFIRDKLEIKILILFVLARLPEPVTLEKLGELVLFDEGISYFDYAESLSELIATGHIDSDGHTYAVTDKGRRNGEITENSLPFSVRVKAEKNAADLRFAMSRQSMISATHSIRRKGGYLVELALSDGISEVISMQLYAANEAQALSLENGFTKNAENIYSKILQSILGEQ